MDTLVPDKAGRDELAAGLPHILAAPADAGTLAAIVVRPAEGERREPDTAAVSLAGGVEGDRWATGCWKTTEAGAPHPDVQVCLMNARCLDLIAGDRTRWALAGDSLIVDFDLTPDNVAPGQRLAIGTAVLEITDEPHHACAKFVARYGRDAAAFVNTGPGRRLKLRGVYARVVEDGRVTVGDTVTKVSRPAP